MNRGGVQLGQESAHDGPMMPQLRAPALGETDAMESCSLLPSFTRRSCLVMPRLLGIGFLAASHFATTHAFYSDLFGGEDTDHP
jgi:hypothetical protein